MSVPAERLARRQGLVEPLRISQGITQGELARLLREAAQEASDLIRFNIERGTISSLAEARRLQAAMQGLSSLSQSLWGRIGRQIQLGIRDAVDLAVEQEIDRTQLLGLSGNGLRNYSETLVFNAFQSAEDIISRRTNGFRLADRIYRNGRAGTLQVGKIVELGLAQQKSARQIAQLVKSFYSPNVRGGASYAANRLARTEINNAHHDTTIRLTKGLPWVTGYKWHLSGSHPRPDICNVYAEDDHDDMGAGVFSKGSVPSKPHPQCLCYLAVEMVDRGVFQEGLQKGRYDKALSA